MVYTVWKAWTEHWPVSHPMWQRIILIRRYFFFAFRTTSTDTIHSQSVRGYTAPAISTLNVYIKILLAHAVDTNFSMILTGKGAAILWLVVRWYPGIYWNCYIGFYHSTSAIYKLSWRLNWISFAPRKYMQLHPKHGYQIAVQQKGGSIQEI